MPDFFKWSDEYLLQISEIDSQHKYFVSLINELYTATVNRAGVMKLKEIIGRLNQYAKDHFATEEKYFKLFEFEGADEHIAEHQKLSAKVKEFSEKINTLDPKTSFEIIDFLESWLLDHLVSMDRKYVDCFHKHGLK